MSPCVDELANGFEACRTSSQTCSGLGCRSKVLHWGHKPVRVAHEVPLPEPSAVRLRPEEVLPLVAVAATDAEPG